MRKLITSDVVVAYSHCPRKAFLLLCTEEQGSPHGYPGLIAEDQRRNQVDYYSELKLAHPNATVYQGRLPTTGSSPILAATVKALDCEAYCDSLIPAPRGTGGRGQRYEPTLVIGTQTVSPEQRVALLFTGYVLSQVHPAAAPLAGTILSTDGLLHKVLLHQRYAEIEQTIETLRSLTRTLEAPPVILNKHCPQCQFRADCLQKAEHDDDLSLLERVTPKARRRYHDRGIFSVAQLSYQYKPRRRRKPSPKAPVQHRLELQALALRTGKTYLHELPALVRHHTEIFMDFEGVPDRHTQYLFGLLTCEAAPGCYQAFWADTDADEARIWRDLTTTLESYPDAPIYHYGHYEARAITALAKRHGTSAGPLLERLVNLNAYVFGKVYFPLRSNRLKDIGRWLGVSWPTDGASGLDSLVWRRRWEDNRDDEAKQLLFAYNESDCRALRALANELTRLHDTGAEEPSVDFSTKPKRYATDTGERIHRQFETILRSASAQYEHAKISLCDDEPERLDEKRRVGAPVGHPGHHRIQPRARKVVQVLPLQECPRCGQSPLQTSATLAEKTIVDLIFTDSGCRKTVTKYVGARAYCRQCQRSYLPPGISDLLHSDFGHGFQAWAIYQRLALRLPYAAIVQAIYEQFQERVNSSTIVNFVRYFARDYAEAEERCLRQLLCSPFIHADETKISIQGVNQYVWVFTDGSHVLFRLTATRETAVVQELLAGYSGVLITDFYGGYDAVPCRQQKCLVHLIRDLNDDLWRRPFDSELEAFVLAVRELLVPILDAANKYGLKKRHLGRFARSVDRFYKQYIMSMMYGSEQVRTYQKRFLRYRQSMFTFMEYDGIPWNNNMGERAIRHLAIQRKISGSFSESLVPSYLLLLGLSQTCRFQGKPLLKFLLSGQTDIDAFKTPRRRSSSGRNNGSRPALGLASLPPSDRAR